ncbi:hypothetical protein GOBAR_AA35038 [Gossypium barbadense]|uniref:Uncharacterized protein n=1 Tax=Gossypium barbadense TaxID=3634 RepID=A0A2P5W3I2_GOSBA|nr:hypothetical protein GOBAR_AA35038 [Gossypium barbadense]
MTESEGLGSRLISIYCLRNSLNCLCELCLKVDPKHLFSPNFHVLQQMLVICEIDPYNYVNYVILFWINLAGNDLIIKLDLEKAKLDGIKQMKAKLVRDNKKIKESIEQAKLGSNHFKGISHVIKCACGEEYMLDLRA